MFENLFLRHRLFFFIAIALSILGIIVQISSSSQSVIDLNYSKKTFILLALALLAFQISNNVNLETLRKGALPIYLSGFILLVLCYFPHFAVEKNGESRWLTFPILPFTIQASEFARIALIIALAAWFARAKKNELKGIAAFLIPCIFSGVLLLLILFEKDISVTLLCGLICACVFLAAGVSTRFLAISGTILIAILCVITLTNKNRSTRIDAFLHPDKHKDGAAMQQSQARKSIQSGGLLGVGFKRKFDIALPDKRTDFIFAVLAFRFGAIACLLVAMAYFLIAMRGVFISMQLTDWFSRLVCVGLACSFFLQASLHVAVNLRLLPGTGIPLPFISQGGSNLIANFISIGILTNLEKVALAKKGRDIGARLLRKKITPAGI